MSEFCSACGRPLVVRETGHKRYLDGKLEYKQVELACPHYTTIRKMFLWMTWEDVEETSHTLKTIWVYA